MSVPAPHFLLRARANRLDRPGRWCFMLESNDGSHSMKVEDDEPDTHGERLELLALVRGLEAVPQPAHVTVVATSRYVDRVLNGGLEEWRANDWRWEHHGEMVPVKNADLWRRVDRALNFHKIDCRSTATLATRCHEPSHRTSHAGARSAQPQGDARFIPHANRGGARSAVSSRQAASPAPPTDACGRKSLSRNALAFGVSLRRRFRQTCRRWRGALERFSAEPDRFEWAD
jgi:ribonuclease HI